MLTIGSTVLGVNDVARATAFWHAALGYVPQEPGDETWVILVPASGPGAQLALMLSRTPVQEHPRIHLDLYADDQDAEVERLVSLGARRIDWHQANQLCVDDGEVALSAPWTAQSPGCICKSRAGEK